MEKSLPVSLGLHRWCDCDFSLATGLLPKEIKLNFIEKKVPTKRKGRILCYNKSWETLPQEQMILVIPPPTWKATGIRAKEEQCCLACCRKPHFIGMQELQQNKEEEKENGKMASTTAFNGNGMMAPHPPLHGFKSVIPREHIWGCKWKDFIWESLCASFLFFDAPVRGNVSIVCGFLICCFEKNTKSFHEKVEYCALCWVKRVVVFE